MVLGQVPGAIGTPRTGHNIVYKMTVVTYVYAHVAQTQLVRHEKFLLLFLVKYAQHVLLIKEVMACNAHRAGGVNHQRIPYQTGVSRTCVALSKVLVVVALAAVHVHQLRLETTGGL